MTFPPTDVQVTKSDATDPIAQGANQTYTVTVTNNGPNGASGIIVTDVLDPNTTYVSDTGGCVEGPVGTLNCPLGTLAASASTNFDVVVTVPNGAPSSGTLSAGPCTGAEDICNNVTVEIAEPDTDSSNDTASEPTDVLPRADLSISKVDATDPIEQGANQTYTISLDNNGPDAATNVVITDVLDANTAYVSDTFPSGCVEAPAGTLTCTVGTLAAAGNVTFDVVVTVRGTAPTIGGPGPMVAPCTGAEDICNSVSVVSDAVETAPGDETADQPTDVVVALADLSITKTDSVDPVQQGANFTYTIQVDNLGPDTASNVVVTDVLDVNTSYLSDTGGCVEAPVGTLTCALGSIAAFASNTFDVTVTVSGTAPTAGGPGPMASPCGGGEDICNNVSVSTTTPDPVGANDSTSQPSDVVPAGADLVITKVDDIDPIGHADSLTYTVRVTNNGLDDAYDVEVVDTLDTNTTYVSDTGGCTEAPVGTLTCPLGFIGASAFAEFDVTVTVNVDAPHAGGPGPHGSSCGGGEDLCNTATVSATTPESNPGD